MGVVYDYIIIGGGLSGLFFAYRLLLLDSSLKVLILEKHNRVGGRLNSMVVGREGGILEMGHDEVNPDLSPLLNDFLLQSGLMAQVSRKEKRLEYLLANHHYQSTRSDNFPFQTDGYERPDLLIQDAYHCYRNLDDKRELYQISTGELLEQVTTPDQWQFIKTTYPFWSLLYSTNAEEGEKLIRNIPLVGKRYNLKKGISQITKYLVKQLTKWGCLIKLNRKVTLLNESPELTQVVVETPQKTHNYYTKKTILALPPMAIKALNTLNFGADCFSLLDNFVTVPTCKVFLVFPKQNGKFWYSGLANLVTGNNLNYLIPICLKTGIFMVSYTEGQQSIPIFEAQLEGRLLKYILRLLQNLFPNINIPKPIYHQIVYKKMGRYLIPPGVDGSALKNILSQPTKLPIYLIGDSYSQNVDCLEGSLESALAVLLDIYQDLEKPSPLLDDLEMVPQTKIEGDNIQSQETDLETDHEIDPVVSMEISKGDIDINVDNSIDNNSIDNSIDIGELPFITRGQLETHNQPNDAWIGLFGYVYQITHWLNDHHGYGKWLIHGLGRDYTLEFQHLVNLSENGNESYPNFQELQQSLIKTIIGKLEN